MSPVAHYRPRDGWVGDVHPIYLDGQWQVPYLEVPVEPKRDGLAGLSSQVIVSEHLLKWKKRKVRNFLAKKPWWLIANIEKDGRVFSYSNGKDGMILETSDNHVDWNPYPENPVIPYRLIAKGHGFRDPYVFWNEKDRNYLMVVAGKKPGDIPYLTSGLYWVSRSDDLYHWSVPEVLYDPGNIGVPECPELFTLGGQYYLLGSWASGRVGPGRYRVADSPNGPWHTPAYDMLDGPDIMAPNTAADPDGRRLFFGWIPTRVGRVDHGTWQWAGHLAFPREVWRDPADGALYLRPPRELLALRDSDRAFGPEEPLHIVDGTWTRNQDGIAGKGGTKRSEIWLPGAFSQFELETAVTMADGGGQAGIVFRRGDRDHPGYEVCLDRRRGRLILRVAGEERCLVERAVSIVAGRPMTLRVFLDGDIVEVFLDDRWSLAGRAHHASAANRVGFFGQGEPVSFAWPHLYTLKTIYPDLAEKRQSGGTGP